MAVTSRFSIRATLRGTKYVNKRSEVMVRQSCAIGPCPEKTYKRSEGVKFFNIKYIDNQEIKSAWKKKIIATRADIKSESDLKDAVVCSRHFVDGDKRNLPTIIPRIIGGKLVWPDVSSGRRPLVRRQLPFESSKTEEIPSVRIDHLDPPSQNDGTEKKLLYHKTLLESSPEKLVKDISKKKEENVKSMPTPVKRIYRELEVKTTYKSPPLAMKLKLIQEKTFKEPHGIPAATVTRTPDVKDSMILQLKKLLEETKTKIMHLELKIATLEKSRSFGIDRFKGNPIDFQFYTGLPDYLTFLSFVDFLQPGRHPLSSLYYQFRDQDASYVNTRGREPVLSIHDQLFLVLSRMRQGYRELDLAHRFNISIFTVSEIFSKWVSHMSHIFDQVPIWAPRALIDEKMPQVFKDLKYGDTRCIIDCTEIFIQQPSSNLVMQSVLFSHYKNHHTAKGLIGIAPHGPVTFVSDLYAGSATDYDITKDCGILKLLEPGDHVMADKGFEIQNLLDEIQVRVDHPPILRGIKVMNIDQEMATRRIAKLRIHVERAIERVKNFRILQDTFPQSQWRMLNDIWKCCAKLTLLQPCIIEETN